MTAEGAQEGEMRKQEIWSKALTFLAMREHSCQQLRQKLKRYCNSDVEDEALIEDTLAQLIAKGWLSDHRFAQAYIESRANRGFGPRRIQWELETRGVASSIISDLLNENDATWDERLAALRRKKFSMNKPSNQQQRMKQRQFFYSRGFTSSQIDHIFKQPATDDLEKIE